MKFDKTTSRSALMIFMAFLIPAFFALEAVQSTKYNTLENEVRELEKREKETIESNKLLISEIGMLSSANRIEKIAIEQLGMHQATSDEIIRVEMKSHD